MSNTIIHVRSSCGIYDRLCPLLIKQMLSNTLAVYSMYCIYLFFVSLTSEIAFNRMVLHKKCSSLSVVVLFVYSNEGGDSQGKRRPEQERVKPATVESLTKPPALASPTEDL